MKFHLNGKRGVVFVDLHGIANDEDMLKNAEAEVFKEISFRKHPKGASCVAWFSSLLSSHLSSLCRRHQGGLRCVSFRLRVVHVSGFR